MSKISVLYKACHEDQIIPCPARVAALLLTFSIWRWMTVLTQILSSLPLQPWTWGLSNKEDSRRPANKKQMQCEPRGSEETAWPKKGPLWLLPFRPQWTEGDLGEQNWYGADTSAGVDSARQGENNTRGWHVSRRRWISIYLFLKYIYSDVSFP